ncbi:MAG: ROK family protein [Ferruginibacter sp.]|nr:ROK family protein [Cytophagales bacterium]
MNAIGIDLGGTWIKAVLLNGAGEIIAQEYRPTHGNRDPSPGPSDPSAVAVSTPWKEAIRETVDALKTKSSAPVAAIGLSAPGLPNDTNTCIARMPGRLQGLELFDWSEFLGQPVHVLNDAQAATMAEFRLGAARGYTHVLMLMLGTGVGGGLILNGQLYQGLFQKAGHLGHVCVDNQGDRDIVGIPGSLEDAIGNATVGKRSLGKYQTTYELLEAHRHQVPFATWLWLDSIRKLAIGISSLINVFSPEVVVLGGGITQADEQLFEPLSEFMTLYEWRPGGQAIPIVQARFGDIAGAIGAASFAISRMQ